MRRGLSWSVAMLIAVATPVAAQHTAHVNSLVRLRAGPGEEYRLAGEANAGNPVTVYGCLETGRWCDVRGPDTRGWMPAQAIVSGRGAVAKAVPKLTFALDAYWGAHYQGREWTAESERALWRAHVPGDSPSLDMMAPSDAPQAGVPTIAKRLKAQTRSENERVQGERAEIDRAARNRYDADRRDDKIQGCERSGGQDSTVQGCISNARSDYDRSVRERETR
ncbi:SH3 domain-containing protein [Xanthomonas nasturtii]|uniref:SH3b domain-containing protein n=1 Tax=Xanthomonas nasturtii TaxID=1843581 RepID=A0A3E1KM27_9XANT|nr:SH3 domain-containing protein [Xanthomonas nasturtii]MCL1500705.1 SH3 domain-containing protein [Xanthomonas nasturtii]MCL1504462.1 SH3 domain-containing protein [Xanthomonas nasturtii]MCL1522811.1 SH3 domain-containing protein [Xanthomonas nasturtii]MCL1526264.1 SH3 domain-containing protein [Xanthomonas nasturtii]MCL1530555.1 SH3 domain-containing protein [Xanthomonas nasturtii]